MRHDVRFAERGGPHTGLVGIGGHDDARADLAVDRHRQLDGGFVEQRGVGIGEGELRERIGVTEHGPQLFGNVGRERCEHGDERLGDGARRAARCRGHRREVVVELDELRDRCVEPQRFHVGAHAVDGLVQQANSLVGGCCLDDARRAGVLVDEIAPHTLQEAEHADHVARFPRA